MAKKKNDGQMSMGGEIIIRKSMDQVMHDSMIPYAEHVILERALPRVEDGLKPVQRRILYTMLELSLSPDKPYRKSARIVGDCLGKYHPHGDSSVYDAMVRMAQDFNMEAPLVDGHGNFGSVDGDCAAAMRYTEARMTPLAMEILRDLDKDTVKFNLNFDDSLKEPDVLPGRFPNLLVNGASGIAVGLATNIPPHNLGEAIDATVAMMENPDITLDEIMQIMPSPDFPTGGYILSSSEIRTAYETGRGRIIMRAKAHIEPQKNGKNLIVVTEMPYQVNKANALEKILAVSQEKKLLFSGIADIRDESDRMGMRAVIEVKKDADPEKILQYLYKYSDLQTTFGVNMVAIANGKPQQMGVLEILRHYIRHQEDVVTRRTRHELENARKREHILAGLMIAVQNLDEVIAIIRAAKSPKEARAGLMERFALTEVQAQAILDLRLQRLTNMELLAIEKEYKDILKLIKKLEAILASHKKLIEVIKGELLEIREQYAVARRTEMLNEGGAIEIDESELKVVEEAVVTFLPELKIRRSTKKLFNPEQAVTERAQFTLQTATDKKLRIFTNKGAQLLLAVEEIPETKPAARPANLASLLSFEDGEKIIAVFEEHDDGDYFFFTKAGYVKRTAASEYKTRTKRIAAVTLKEGDELIAVEKSWGESILLVTSAGMSIRFGEDTVPAMGRAAAGVRGIKLEDGDFVLYATQTVEEGEVLLISDRGYAKRSLIFDHELQGRYGKGLKSFDFKKNGSNGTCVAAAFYVREPFDFNVIQFHGTVTRANTDQVFIEPRAGRGQLLVMALLDDIVTGAEKC
ncbi:MAG: DNA gyrase subunit A [Clostridia bacterium]|nr:DNA gyrase subunit A [Clostridia bacterium]